MDKDDVYRLIDLTGPSPTIGEQNVRLRRMPVCRSIDFHDTTGRLHALILLVPTIYAFMQLYRGQQLSGWFWWITLGALGFALFVRRPAYVRLGAGGISFPERKSTEYAWDTMTEARARDDELDILTASGEHVTISLRRLRRTDAKRIKHLIKAQFSAIAERAVAAEEEAARLDEAA